MCTAYGATARGACEGQHTLSRHRVKYTSPYLHQYRQRQGLCQSVQIQAADPSVAAHMPVVHQKGETAPGVTRMGTELRQLSTCSLPTAMALQPMLAQPCAYG